MLDDYPTTQQPHFLDQGKKDEKKKESWLTPSQNRMLDDKTTTI
jgi:hypothetical protein